MEGDRRVPNCDIPAIYQRLELGESSNPGVDCAICESIVREEHQFDVPSNIEISAC